MAVLLGSLPGALAKQLILFHYYQQQHHTVVLFLFHLLGLELSVYGGR